MSKKTKGQPIGEPFFPIVQSLFASAKYRALAKATPFAALVLHLMMSLHNREKNGGLVSLGAREAASWYSVTPMTAWRAMKALQTAGFITEIHKGHLVPQIGRSNVSTTWRINVAPFTSTPKGMTDADETSPRVRPRNNERWNGMARRLP